MGISSVPTPWSCLLYFTQVSLQACVEHCTDALIPIAIAEKYKTPLHSHLNTCLEHFFQIQQYTNAGCEKHTLFEVLQINFQATDHKRDTRQVPWKQCYYLKYKLFFPGLWLPPGIFWLKKAETSKQSSLQPNASTSPMTLRGAFDTFLTLHPRTYRKGKPNYILVVSKCLVVPKFQSLQSTEHNHWPLQHCQSKSA